MIFIYYDAYTNTNKKFLLNFFIIILYRLNYSFINTNMNTHLSPSSEKLKFKLFVYNCYLICAKQSITIIICV